ncbi:tyrosine-type recombinase/integrase [Nonomuraea sp. NPDC049684]|uniref:tyrosine-type recombinase/integrase n=1 Tax=Nonomuraea sp. NPDC049684 TaxID=3364356 RepID=UPI0037B2BB99
MEKYADLDLHQLRHSAATRLGEAEVPLQLIMGKTRHKNPRSAMRYVNPGVEAIAKVTEVLAPRCRTHHRTQWRLAGPGGVSAPSRITNRRKSPRSRPLISARSLLEGLLLLSRVGEPF